MGTRCIRHLSIYKVGKAQAKGYYPNPIEVPRQTKGVRRLLKPSNIFVQHNIGSSFILLNRPEALNSINLQMIQDLHAAYKEIEENESIGLVILHGAGEKAFCAGGDVATLGKMGRTPMGQEAKQMEFFREEYRLDYRISKLSNTIQFAVLDGYVMGGGAGLSINGRGRIASEDTVFSMPETALGFFPDVGASHWLTRLPAPGLGMYLALTGRRLNGPEMLGCGLATHFIPLGQIPGLFDRVESIDQYDEETAYDIIDEFSEPPDPSLDVVSRQLESIGDCFGAIESIPALRDALASRTGEQDKYTLAEALRTEYRLARRFIAGADFYEGVRAMLIDKDRRPVWQPPPTPDQVKEYFEPLPPAEELSLDL